ncbi:hypothetical protein D3C73_908280 [compost metagenome]
MNTADALLCGLREHRYVDRVLRHQFGQEGTTFQPAKTLGLNVGQVEEVLAHGVPEGRPAFGVAVADDLGDDRFGEALRMGGDEHQARSG